MQPQYGNTTSDVMVVIVVEDVNDHQPTFSSSAPYTAFVREDTPLDSLIYFDGDGYIYVSDMDQVSVPSYFHHRHLLLPKRRGTADVEIDIYCSGESGAVIDHIVKGSLF